MKKKIAAIILVCIMILSMAGCAKKTTLAVTIDGIGDYRVVRCSDSFKNFSTHENEILLTLKNDGVYAVVVQDDDGKEYTFTVTYQNGKAEVTTEDDMTVNMHVE